MNYKLSKPKRLYQEIGHQLYTELSSGRYKVGDRLPPERDIAERFSVSRAVVREALIMLELMELIEVRKGSGVYVIKLPSASSSNDTIEKDLDEEDAGPFEMMQARQLIESYIAEFAATQVTKNDIRRMREALDMERKNIDLEATDYDGDKMFHLAIAEATQNSVLVDVLLNLWERRERSPMWKQLHSHITDQTYRKKWLVDHDNILTAIQRRNPNDARQAMWQHLENVKNTLMELSEHGEPDFDGYLFIDNPVQIKAS
ncbi:FCD domain-containing protein [Halomonas sp. EGI 63088]|uniref:FCD domain-containing protein n=1 Tax=Halomonas flagellata TaxID=2920385 RepID=A0ABS9S0F5_9GAMM|nr:FCD domain-containing protein [Halomonas flagellata]MCH4565485.1 FCD domain-containing protein [Halomonas flagellata]